MEYIQRLDELLSAADASLSNPLKAKNEFIIILFQLHDVFTKFTKEVIEGVLYEYNNQLIDYYNLYVNRLIHLSDDLEFIKNNINIKEFEFPFKLNKKLHTTSFVAIDVGGTLAKLAYTTSKPLPSNYKTCLNLYQKSCLATRSIQLLLNKAMKKRELEGWSGRLYNFPSLSLLNNLKLELLKIQFEENRFIAFKIFKNTEIDIICNFIKTNSPEVDKIYITGGKSLDYVNIIHEATGITPEYINEVESVPNGVRFLYGVDRSFFRFDLGVNDVFSIIPGDVLVANFGSGTSFIRVDKDKSERINGSSIGGGSILGVLHRITNQSDMLYLQISSECVFNHELLELNRGLNTIVNSDALETIEMMYTGLGKLTALLAKQQGLKHCLFTGLGILDSVYPLYLIASKLPESSLIFSHHGGFVGCLGCLPTAFWR